jgi:hypothetical protein
MLQANPNWTPMGPYRIKSGKHAGKTLEQILLHNISDFLKMKWALENNTNNPIHLNGYHRHFIWLIGQIDQLVASTICSECDQAAIILPALGSHHEGYHFLTHPLCPDCRQNGQWHNSTVVRLSPWFLSNFKTKVDKKRAWETIKATLGIPKKTNGQQLFELLTKINNDSSV